LATSGRLSGRLRIPDAASTLTVIADLRAGQILCECQMDAPKQGRPRTRVKWLIRQLDTAPDSLRIEAFVLHSRGPGTAELLKSVRPNPDILITDPSKEFKSFRLTQITPMGTKRGTGRGSFIDSVVEAVDDFYQSVLQNLRTWTAPPPKLRDQPDVPDVKPALVSTALSSQDEPTPLASQPQPRSETAPSSTDHPADGQAPDVPAESAALAPEESGRTAVSAPSET
jgi:hypothetical protein